MTLSASNKKNKLKTGRYNLIFYSLMMIWPLLQFFVFYVLVKFNSVLYAFQDYDLLTDKTVWTFDNMRNAFSMMTQRPLFRSMMSMSLLTWVIGLAIGTPLALIFSYYIYKELPASGFFRVMLFLPSVISAIVMTTIYQFFVERALPEIVRVTTGIKMQGLMGNPDTRFFAVMFYNIWVSFGVSVLMYSDGMNRISTEVVESAHLDGATGLREFWYITVPLVYPTLSTFLITGVAGIFLNQANLFSFYGNSAPESLQTYGYYIYMQTEAAASRAEYPILSAIGLYLTILAVPLTLVSKYCLERFGPKEE